MSSSHLKYEIILIVMGKAGYLTQNKKFSINKTPATRTGVLRSYYRDLRKLKAYLVKATEAVGKFLTK